VIHPRPPWGERVSTVGPAPLRGSEALWYAEDGVVWQGAFRDAATLTLVAEGRVRLALPCDASIHDPNDHFDTLFASCCEYHLDERGALTPGFETGLTLLAQGLTHAYWVPSALRERFGAAALMPRLQLLARLGYEWFHTPHRDLCVLRQPRTLVSDFLPEQPTLARIEQALPGSRYTTVRLHLARLLTTSQPLWAIDALQHLGGFDKTLAQAVFTALFTRLPFGYVAGLFPDALETLPAQEIDHAQ
jgi:hypothetical protein